MLNEDLYPQSQGEHIKLGKHLILKGLWMSKFDIDKSTEIFMDAHNLFEELDEDYPSFFATTCELEIGSNFLRKSNSQTANSFIFKAFNVLKKAFGDDHPILQKYYSYASEIASFTEDNNSMLELTLQCLKIAEKHNQKEDGTQSIFLLDPLVAYISMLSQTKTNNDQTLEQIERLQQICGENGIVNSIQLLHSANTIKSLVYIRQEKIDQALETLQESYENQVKALKGKRAHPFLEHSMNQLGLLFKVSKMFEEAEEMYGNII